MRQSWYFRLLGLLLLPLYSTGAWIAPALQVCPMHGSPPAAHSQMGHSQMALSHGSMVMAGDRSSGETAIGENANGMAAEDMPGHSAHSASSSVAKASNLSASITEASASATSATDLSATDLSATQASVSEAPANAHSHGCDCLGCCAGSNGPAVPATQMASVDATETAHTAIDLKNADVVVRHVAHVLPFATAPPNTLV